MDGMVKRVDFVARAGHTWQTGRKDVDGELARMRGWFGHRVKHWPEDGDVSDAPWLDNARTRMRRYDDLHLAWATEQVARNKSPKFGWRHVGAKLHPAGGG